MFGYFFSSNMAGAAAKILDGLGDKSLSNKQADDFLKWMGDLAGDSFEDNDDSFLEARIHFIYIKTKLYCHTETLTRCRA